MDLETELRLSYYKEIGDVDTAHHVKLVQQIETGKVFVLKTLRIYDMAIFLYLAAHPSKGMSKIVDLIEDSNTLYVVEEYITGTSLYELLQLSGPFSSEVAVGYIDQLCDILRPLHAHTPPVVHRDIKPSNLILTSDGALVLIDFNAAKESTEGKSQDTVLIGTAGYAAPEQYGFAVSTPTADIYAIGVLLNELLTGHFPNQTRCTGPLWPVVKKCTQMGQAQRYQTIDQLQEALHRAGPQRRVKPGLRGWLPPGFRSNRPWIIIASSLWYLFFIALCLVLGGEGASVGELIYIRIGFILIFFIETLFVGNYRNIWACFPLSCSKNPWLKACGVFLYALLFWGLAVFALAFLAIKIFH